MRSATKRVCVAALLAALLIAAAPAPGRAQPDADARAARDLFQRAEARFRAKDYGAALALYEQAYRRKPLFGFHFNIGQCNRHLGRHDEALRHFRLYVAAAKNPEHRRTAEELIALCQRERAAQGQRLEGPREANPRTAAPPAARARPAMHPLDKAHPTAAVRFKAWHFWAAAGLSAALLATATISGIMTLQKSLEFNDPDTDYNRLRALQSAGTTLRTTSIVTVVLGSLGAAGAAWMYFRTDFGARGAITAAPLADGAALVVSGWF